MPKLTKKERQYYEETCDQMIQALQIIDSRMILSEKLDALIELKMDPITYGEWFPTLSGMTYKKQPNLQTLKWAIHKELTSFKHALQTDIKL